MVEMTNKLLFRARYRYPGASMELEEIILVLADEKFKKGLTIALGYEEAHSIDTVLKKLDTPRPLPHDVIVDVVKRLGAEVTDAEIYESKPFKIKLIDSGVEVMIEWFLSRVNIQTKKGKKIIVDARPSDAVALALRAKAPIYVAEELLEQALEEDFEDSSGQNFRQLLFQLEEKELKKFKV